MNSQFVNTGKLNFGYINTVTYTEPWTEGLYEKGGQLMKKEKKKFTEWIKEHKTELIIAGVSIAAIIAIVIGIKNREALEKAWESLRKLLDKSAKTVLDQETVPTSEFTSIEEGVSDVSEIAKKIPHYVAEHLRNLPEGWNASAEKIATAAEHGYELFPGQTWVESYRTGGFVA